MPPEIQERRIRIERRRSFFGALWRGNFARRRLAPRRRDERHAVVTDWFHAHWLAVAIVILLLCATDAVLTLTLLSHGAVEVNPLMDHLIRGSSVGFSSLKIGLTGMGILILTLLARLRIWGKAVGTLLYVVLAGYVLLVGYELFLLRNIPLD